MTPKPKYTGKEYTGIEHAYAVFNDKLFGGELPDLLITYQRKAGSCGYYSPGRFERRGGQDRVPELALNPAVFRQQSDMCQTAPKIDPQSASNFDPLELSVMASPRGRGGELIGFCV